MKKSFIVKGATRDYLHNQGITCVTKNALAVVNSIIEKHLTQAAENCRRANRKKIVERDFYTFKE